jgi:hypothetical protein
MNPLLLKATTAMTIWMISIMAITTKGHNSDLPIIPTLLTQSRTDTHKYLITIQQIEAVTTDNLEILDYSWTPSYLAHRNWD